MSAVLGVSIVRSGLGNFRKSDMRRAGRKGMRLVGKLQHRENVPRKFKSSATGRYGLKRRSVKYNRDRRARRRNGDGVRAIGEVAPFVWSGHTRATVLSQQKVRAKAPSAERHYVDVIYNARVFNFSRGKRIDLHEEFQKVTDPELRKLQKSGAERYQRELDRTGRRVRKRLSA